MTPGTACSSPDSSVHGDSPGKNTGVGCHALLQGIFATQGSNLGLLHHRQILYHLRHQGSPFLGLYLDKTNSKRYTWNFPGGPVVKNLLANAGGMGLIPGLGRSPMLQSN